MSESRKLAAILAADVVGFSRMTSADEDDTLSRLRTLRSELIDPAASAHKGRIFKRTGDGFLAEFRSVVDSVRCVSVILRPRATMRRWPAYWLRSISMGAVHRRD